MERKKRSWVSWGMALLLALNLLVPIGTVYAAGGTGADKTALLTNVSATFKQSGTEITGTTLPNADNLSIEVSFGVPVMGDYQGNDQPNPDVIVQKGDTADIPLGTGFTLCAVSGNLPIDLTTTDENPTVIGQVTAFNTDSTTKLVTAHVIFNGDIMGDEDISGITAGFKANMQCNSDGGTDTAGNTIFTLLGKTYTIIPPAVPVTYAVTKNGTVDLANKRVNWTVEITAAQGGSPAAADLEGYTVSDDLTSVGAYVPDSLMVGPSSGILTARTPALAGSVLSYTLPGDSISPQKVTFSTAISDTNYYAGSQQTIANTVQLMNGATELAHGMGSVSFTPQWISKSGQSSDRDTGNNLKTGVYDPTDRTITWTITANQSGASLSGVYITDILPSGLTLKSATWQKWDTATNGWGAVQDTWTVVPADGKYVIGDISTQILLTIVTNVPDDVHGNGTYTAAGKTYTNSAKIFWTGGPDSGIGSGNASATVGYNAISKSGSLDTNYRVNRTIHWSVTVDPKGQAIPDMTVYDLLVYGSSINLSAVTGISAGIAAADLTPQYNQKYLPDTFSGAGSLTGVYTLRDSQNNAVADLMEISVSGTTASTFTLDTQVVNPDVYAGNTTPTVYNTATLFSANAKLNKSDASVSYQSHMLAKEMLQRRADPTTESGANTKTTDMTKGFDYVDKSVIFRLSVNANGMDLTGLLGAVTVTDTLPKGWVFDTFSGGQDLLIFNGTVNTGGSSVTAKGSPLSTVSGLAMTPIPEMQTAGPGMALTFSSLSAPYVILVKAKPASDTAAGYFDSNESHTVTNNLTLKADNWTTGISASQQVEIDSTILNKSLDTSKAHSDGYLTWTVDYTPYQLTQAGTALEDTLPAGLDLRTDSSGALVLGGNIAINKLTLNPDGSYALGPPVTPVLGTNVSYNNATRVLSFQIPDSTQAYRFTYVTDITGEPGTVSNQVALVGGTNIQENSEKSYTIADADGWATLQRNGSITITKTDGSGTALPGAEFTLYALDGATVIRKGTTASGGTLKMRAIPAGQYILRETAIPSGYLSENVSATPTDHAVTVAVSGSAVTTSIDGKTGAGSNILTVKNYHEGTAGNLTIGKTVAGNAADQTKAFTFTLNLTGASGEYYYTGNGVPDGTISSGDTISLAHGQSITVIGLPKDATYSVTESNYSSSGYSTVSTVTGGTKTAGANSTAGGSIATGTIVADDTQTVSFTNTRNVYPSVSTGNLTISKTVAGTGADTTKAFRFTVTFTDAPGTYSYTGIGVPGGTIKSGGTVFLAHGQSITIAGLPAGAGYQVSEDAASAQGYTTASAGSSGSILAGDSQTAAFTNTKISDPGSLTISKTVAGKGASLTRKFQFTVALTGAPDAYSYTGASSGTLRSGDTVSLSGGESITITGLPAGAGYTVTEADYSGVGYTASSTGASGVISTGAAQTAAFTNSWSPLPNKPGTPANPTEDIGEGGVPTGPADGSGSGKGTPGGSKGGSGMPRTGDSQTGTFAKLGLLASALSLAVFSGADLILRKKYSEKKDRE